MRKNKDLISRLFFNQKFVFVFSLVAAFVFWLVITITENPVRDITFSNITISVSTEGTAAGELGLDVISVSSETASVKVSGPSYILSTLDASNISVSATLANVTEAGTYQLPLSAVSNTSGVNVLSVTPSSVTAVFDYFDTKDYSLEAEAVGAVAVSGLVADKPSLSDNTFSTISISGARSELQKISRVVAEATVNKTLEATESFDAVLKLYDASGNELPAELYTLPSDKIKVTVPILKKKEVSLKATFSNAPNGFSEKDLSYKLSTNHITILGPATTVDTMDSAELMPIDFYSISSDSNSFDVAPVLPNGVKPADNIETVTVSINTSSLSEKTFNISNFEFSGIGTGLSAKASNVMNVKICGPRAVIRSIKSSDLYAIADLTGKSAGQYTVAVKINSKSYNNVWQVGTYNVVVTVK